jgi:capsular exopolysaccharide synthesis family protein
MIPGSKKSAFTLHTVFQYVAIAAKHARLMALLVCFSFTTGLTYYVFARPVYFSRAIVHVDYLALPMDTDKIYRDGQINSIAAQLTAPHILLRTARKLGVKVGATELERQYLFKLRAVINAEQDIDVQVWPWSPDWAYRWTETMVDEFLADRQEKRIEDKNHLISGYSEELKEVIAKLDQQFSEKLDFENQQDFTRSLILINSINDLPRRLTYIQMRLDELGRVRVRLQDPKLDVISKLSLISTADKTDTRLSIGQTVDTPTETEPQGPKGNSSKTSAESVVVVPALINTAHSWDALAQEQQQVKSQLEEASRTYLPGHRKMIDLNKRLASIDEQLNAELETASKRFDLQYQEVLNQKHDLEGKLPEYQELSRKHSKLLTQLTIFDMSRIPYDTYLAEMKKKINTVEFAGEKERTNLKYGGLIEVRDDPVSPNRLKITLLCLAAGGALAIGVPYLIEYLDHTMTNLDEVESTFRLRGLGVVPQTNATDILATSVDEDTQSHSLVENFRVIRTNMLSMGMLTKPPHVVMITSAMPKEGKTVVSSNLAASFALTGAKTLLIDTDLRRGRLHRLFGYRKEPGLSNVLLGESTLQQAFRPTPQKNLTVLSAGTHLPSGTELLGSPEFAELMKDLRSQFDRIVIDTPPVLGLSETSIMQAHVDGVLFVIWTGHTPKSGVQSAIEMLRANGANFYGFVLNRLDLNATQNYYHYYYYSHDYYYQRAIETT